MNKHAFDKDDLLEDFEEEDYKSNFFKWLSIVLVTVAIAAFGVLGWYSYQSSGELFTSVNGIPVIEAESSPTKIKPENPGGETFAHQDKEVYDILSTPDAKNTGAPVFQPSAEEPMDDWVQKQVAQTQETKQKHEETVEQTVQTGKPAEVAPAEVKPAETKIVEVTPETAKPAETTLATTDAVKPESPPTQSAKEEPKQAPSNVFQSALKEEPAKPEAKPAPDTKATAQNETKAANTKPASTAAGDYRVQLASLQSKEEAGTTKTKLAEKLSSSLQGKSLIVERADLGKKGIYHRVQATGFASKQAATDWCNSIKAQQSCFVLYHP